MSPADQHQAIDWRRSTEPPTLWLSLALGSVLIHLVLFILVSIVLTRTAKVEVNPEPIAVEFVDPNPNPVETRSTAPDRVIAARPSQPAPNAPARPQAPLTTQIPQTAVEPRRSTTQPLAPLQPIKRKPIPQSPRQPQPSRTSVPSQTTPATKPIQPQPNPIRDPFSQQPISPEPTRTQPAPDRTSTQTALPGSVPNPSGDPDPQPSGLQGTAERGDQIAQLPQGRSVEVSVSNAPRQVIFDRQQQPARPIKTRQTVSVDYPDVIAQISGGSVRIEVTLQISDKGLVVGVGKPKLLSLNEAVINQGDLDYVAEQIFRSWEFEPAQDASGLKPLTSNLIIDAQIQFP